MQESLILIQHGNSGRIGIEDCEVLVDHAVEIPLVKRGSDDLLGFRVHGGTIEFGEKSFHITEC